MFNLNSDSKGIYNVFKENLSSQKVLKKGETCDRFHNILKAVYNNDNNKYFLQSAYPLHKSQILGEAHET